MGVRLRPFSLGHFIVLQRVRSPFVSDEDLKVTVADLIFAVWACSRSWEKALSSFDERFDARLKWLRLRSFFMTPQEIAERMLMFRRYVNDAFSVDKPLMSDSKTRHCTTPMTMMLVQTLTREYGLSRSEALDTPVGQAIMEHYAIMESAGAVTFVSDEILRAKDILNQQKSAA